AVAALLAEPTIERAAQSAGVGYRTLKLWLTQADFLAAYRAARREIVEGAVMRLQQAALAAVLALERNLTCGKPAAEIAAARAVLEQALGGVQLFDLAQQLADLRAQVGEAGGHGGAGVDAERGGAAPATAGQPDGRARAGPGPAAG